jgi:hypothetical protein
MAELTYAQFGLGSVWVSGLTQHVLVNSDGSMSKASFISTFGLGAGTLASKTHRGWQYAQTFFGTIASAGENALVAAGMGSHDTLHVVWQNVGSTGSAYYSYLTSAPRAVAVTSHDNYLIAFNTEEAGEQFATRVRWCVRGSPSNWTSEGSGFEDLLAMRGEGTAIKSMADGRAILFTDFEIWYAQPAAYPAQFQFYPLDTGVGCFAPLTIQQCDEGLIFLGSDWNLRILPVGGGPSRVVVPQIAKALRRITQVNPSAMSTWGLYDPTNKLYHLFLEINLQQIVAGLVINMVTGEVGSTLYAPENSPFAGVALGAYRADLFTGTEGLLIATLDGYVHSTSSIRSTDGGAVQNSAVSALWRSSPIAPDLTGNWKQLTTVNLDYRATSLSTVTLRIAGDANTYETTGVAISLASAPVAGRASQDVYRGGMFPAIELTSSSTGFELHRVDVGMNLGGRGR